MYELYSFIAVKGPFKGQLISERAGWQGNAYKGSALFIGDEQMNDNTFRLVLKEVGSLVQERTVYGLYKAMLEAWAPKEPAARVKHYGFI